MANTAFFARNGLNVNNVFIVNNTVAAVGANVLISTADVKVGNSTVNSTALLDRLTIARANGTLLAAVDNGSAGLTVNGAANAFLVIKVSGAHTLTHLANTTGFWINAPDGANNYTFSSNLTVFVGANVSVDHTTLKIGNSTVNSLSNSTILKVASATSTTNVSAAGVAVGTSTINTTAFAAGANVLLTTSELRIGNSTVNAVINSTAIDIDNVTTDTFTATSFAAGANVVVSTADIKIGNSTVNAFANSLLVKVHDATSSANHSASGFTVGTSVVNTTVVAAGANVIIGTVDAKIGNSTVNTFANSVLLKVHDATSSANHSASGFAVGTSVVNTTVVAAGANVIIGTVDIKIGNSTVNAFANSVLLKVANSTMTTNVGPGGVVVGSSSVNTTVVASGANVLLTTVDLRVGNTTVNAFANSVLMKVSDAAAAASVNTTVISVGNSTVNTVATSTTLTMGNTTANIIVTSSNLVIANTTGAYGAALQGKQTIWIPAVAMIARSSNGAAVGSVEMTTNKNMFSTLDFDATNNEFAQFEIAMPKSWNLGTVTFQPIWSHASTSTNFGVVWELGGVARGDDDAGDVAFGTVQSSTDTGGTTNDIYIGPESSAITLAGTPAVGDTVQFQINRAPGNASDTMAVDARLHGVKVYITTNAGNDV